MATSSSKKKTGTAKKSAPAAKRPASAPKKQPAAKAAKTGIDVSLLPAYLIGMFVAMVSGIAAIGLVKRLTSKGRFGAFSYYCWGAGALTMILSLIF